MVVGSGGGVAQGRPPSLGGEVRPQPAPAARLHRQAEGVCTVAGTDSGQGRHLLDASHQESGETRISTMKNSFENASLGVVAGLFEAGVCRLCVVQPVCGGGGWCSPADSRGGGRDGHCVADGRHHSSSRLQQAKSEALSNLANFHPYVSPMCFCMSVLHPINRGSFAPFHQEQLEDARERCYSLQLSAVKLSFTVRQEDAGGGEDPAVYQCPVYGTASRSYSDGTSSYCFTVSLPCASGASSALATAGAALITHV